jgi:2',3'-cyclic-nucleotide 2'-phosphodiesterase (5'-nucleotidase family)
MELTGAQLKRSLAVDITAVSGVRVTFDLTRPHGDRLVSATLEDGSPIIDTAFYSVAVNDFMQAGGDGYDELAKGRNVKDTGERLRDVVTDYIRSKQVVSPVIDGRVQVIR